MDLMKPKKPKSQRLFQRIKRKIQDVVSDVRQKKRSKPSYKQNKKVKDSKESKGVKDSEASEEVKDSKVSAGVTHTSKSKRERRLIRVSGAKYGVSEFRRKRAKRVAKRIDSRKQRKMGRKSPKFGGKEKANASGPTDSNASQGIQCGAKGCAVK